MKGLSRVPLRFSVLMLFSTFFFPLKAIYTQENLLMSLNNGLVLFITCAHRLIFS